MFREVNFQKWRPGGFSPSVFTQMGENTLSAIFIQHINFFIQKNIISCYLVGW